MITILFFLMGNLIWIFLLFFIKRRVKVIKRLIKNYINGGEVLQKYKNVKILIYLLWFSGLIIINYYIHFYTSVTINNV